MDDMASTLLVITGSGIAVWAMWRIAAWMDSRLTPEQRDEREHERWRNS